MSTRIHKPKHSSRFGCYIDNWRWADVPIYMRVGKRLPKSATEISVHFKEAPAVLFNKGFA